MTIRRSTSPLTEAGKISVDSIKNSYPGMAHFAGTGPPGKSCIHCRHHEDVTSRGWNIMFGRCAEYKRMIVKPTKLEKYPSDTPACKYFKEIKRASRR